MSLVEKERMIIIGLVTDLMTIVKIENTLKDSGITPYFIQDTLDILEHQQGSKSFLTDANFSFELIDYLSKERPSLIIVDLAAGNIPSEEWLKTIKQDPATRRIPVLAYGPHIHTSQLKQASDAGADLVVPRSQFLAQLKSLVIRMMRVSHTQEWAGVCSGELSEKGIEGLIAFNKGKYFEAHELLEEAWMEDQTSARDLYRAILQVAVGYYQVERGNYRGAMKMFMRLRQWLIPLPSRCKGVNVDQLKIDVHLVYQSVRSLGPHKIEEFDRRMFTQVEFSVD
jgi:predicted metal-dependent hydrolase